MVIAVPEVNFNSLMVQLKAINQKYFQLTRKISIP